MKQTETSKKFVAFTGVIFILTLMFCMGIFTYCLITDRMCDWTLLVTVTTVSAAPFTAATSCYFSKSKIENKYKIQSTFLKEKYQMLYEMGVLTSDRAVEEIEGEIAEIDESMDAIEEEIEIETL